MSRHKLKKIAAAEDAPNVLHNPENMPKKWHDGWFRNNNPITLELGCGSGEYTSALARMFPAKNFVGIERKGDRLWAGARIALRDHLTNVVFMRVDVQDLLKYFAEDEVAEIWITFPDPLARGTKSRLRLTSDRYLPMYKKILLPGGLVHFKTDHTALFNFTMATLSKFDVEVLCKTLDLYKMPISDIALTIQTAFEKKHLQLADTIKYLKYRFC